MKGSDPQRANPPVDFLTCTAPIREGRKSPDPEQTARLSETAETRRMHMFRQSQRSRRLNLRPPNDMGSH